MTTPCRARSDIEMSNIFLARREHLPFVAELEKEVFSEPWSEKSLELCLTQQAFCVCCFEDGALASYCTVITVFDEAQIINVATRPDFRGRGYAREAINAVFEECRKRGIISISLEVRESNIPAISLYKGYGFTIEGKRKAFYTNPREDAFVMIKNLD